jgi:hypothetical protein
MSLAVQEPQQILATPDVQADRIALGYIVRRVVSEPAYRELFKEDAAEAIRTSGVTLSPAVSTALIRNAGLGADLTVDMDNVASAFFFFLLV